MTACAKPSSSAPTPLSTIMRTKRQSTAATWLIYSTANGSRTDTASVVDATHDYTDTIVQFSEVIGSWVDRTGRNSSGQVGTSYALLRLNLRDAGLLVPRAPNATAAT